MGGVRTSSALIGRLALCIALAGCCVNGWSFARRLLDPPVQPHVSSWREVASGVRARRPALLCRDAAKPAPVERTRLIALNWELAPVCVRAWNGEGGDSLPDAVFVSAWSGEAERDRLASLGFSPVAGNGFAAVWRRASGDGADDAVRAGPRAPSVFREGCGVGAVLLAVAVLVWWTVRGARRPVAGAVAVGLVLFALYAWAALSHRLPAPNGLGVYGGKAKLLLASGGVPDGFWTDPAYGVYQPSYPPGLTLLALAADAVAGGCGDWLVQLLPVGAMTALAVVLLSGTGTWTGRLLVLAVLLSPVSVRLAAEFHAEPFAALCLVAGGRLLRDRGGRAAWWTMGCAGLFRFEGALWAVLLWTASCCSFGRWRDARGALAACLLPCAVWWMVCLCAGWRVPDWDFLDVPSLANVRHAGGLCLRGIVASCPGFGCAAWALALAALPSARRPGMPAGVWAPLSGLAVLCALWGFYAGPDPAWALDMTVPRQVWLAVVLSVGWFAGGRTAPGRIIVL